MRPHADPRRLLQERSPVLTRVVGDAADDTLPVQVAVLDCGDRAHVDAAEHQPPPTIERPQRRRDDLAGRGEDDRRVELARRCVESAADPDGAELLGKCLVTLSVTRAHVHIGAARAGDLDRDVARGAEAVDPQPRAGPVVEAAATQAAIADDPGAQQRRDLLVGEVLRQRIDEVRGGRHVFGEPAVACPPGELGSLAEVLAPPRAKAAHTAGAVQPRDTDAFARRLDDPDDLVPGDHRRATYRQLPLDYVQVGPADTAGADVDQQVSVRGFGGLDIFDPQRPLADRPRLTQYARLH